MGVPKGDCHRRGQARSSCLSPFFLLLLAGCAAGSAFSDRPSNIPPEFNQKIELEVSDEYKMYQAPRSGYDVGDLQAFHTQHTLPILMEDAFREMFSEVKLREKGAAIESGTPEVPAVFEARIIDLAHDIETGADNYRAEVTLAVAMKSPRGNIFWQQAFRGDGYAETDPQFSTKLGPQDAVVDAVRDALEQMQDAILKSPQVRTQLRHYLSIEAARREKEVTV